MASSQSLELAKIRADRQERRVAALTRDPQTDAMMRELALLSRLRTVQDFIAFYAEGKRNVLAG